MGLLALQVTSALAPRAILSSLTSAGATSKAEDGAAVEEEEEEVSVLVESVTAER
jgi:hypothetical protein